MFLRSPTKSHKHFSVDILPFVFADDSQVEAFVSKQEATHSVQPCNLEITISNEIRVAGLGGSKRAAEFVVEASAADLALEGEADSLDIVIDWNQAGSKVRPALRAAPLYGD